MEHSALGPKERTLLGSRHCASGHVPYQVCWKTVRWRRAGEQKTGVASIRCVVGGDGRSLVCARWRTWSGPLAVSHSSSSRSTSTTSHRESDHGRHPAPKDEEC